MKRNYTIFLSTFCVLLGSQISLAQQVRKYCELSFQYNYNKLEKRIGPYGTIHMDGGVVPNHTSSQDSLITTVLRKTESYTTLPDALNYLSQQGWNYNNQIVQSAGIGLPYVYILFYKDFAAPDLKVKN